MSGLCWKLFLPSLPNSQNSEYSHEISCSLIADCIVLKPVSDFAWRNAVVSFTRWCMIFFHHQKSNKHTKPRGTENGTPTQMYQRTDMKWMKSRAYYLKINSPARGSSFGLKFPKFIYTVIISSLLWCGALSGTCQSIWSSRGNCVQEPRLLSSEVREFLLCITFISRAHTTCSKASSHPAWNVQRGLFNNE